MSKWLRRKVTLQLQHAIKRQSHAKYAIATRAEGRMKAYQQVLEWIDEEEFQLNLQPAKATGKEH